MGKIWLKLGKMWLKLGKIWLKLGKMWLKLGKLNYFHKKYWISSYLYNSPNRYDFCFLAY